MPEKIKLKISKNIFVITCFITLFFISKDLAAQSTIRGTVMSSKTTPINYATVSLKELNKTGLIAQKHTDDSGRFEFGNISNGNYQVIVTYIGFEETVSKLVNLEKSNQQIQLDTIYLKQNSNDLNNVVITGKKPLIERKIDRVIFNVEASISATGGNAIDALNVTPGVIFKEETINLIGKSSVRVMIDDRIIQLSGDDLYTFLSTIPSANIQRIEVINTPPAKYDAQGNSGLINIVLKKAKINAWNATVGSNYLQNSYSGTTSLANFTYNKDRLTISANLNFRDAKRLKTETSKIFYPGELWSIVNPLKINEKSISGQAGVDYEISKVWSTGVQYLGNGIKKNVSDNNLTTISDYENGIPESYISTAGSRNQSIKINSYNWHNQFKLDTLGKNISTSLDYLNYGGPNARLFQGDLLDQNQDVIANNHFASVSKNHQYIVNYSAKVDVEIPTQLVNLSFGGKASFSKTNNSINLTNTSQGLNSFDTSQVNVFRYRENTEALYLTLGKKINKDWEVQAGLRTEFTQTSTHSLSTNQENKTNYVKYFPSLFLSYQAGQNGKFTTSYSRRINRPDYTDLDPFKIYATPYDYVEGNPFLSPSYTNNFELNYTYKNFNSKVFYSRMTDAFNQVAIIDVSKNTTRNIMLNYFDAKSIGLEETINLNFYSWWTSTNYFYVVWSKSNSNLIATPPNLEGVNSAFRTSNDFVLNKDNTLLFNLTYHYNLPGVSDLDRIKAYSGMNVSFKALFANKKLILTVSGNDLFRTEYISTSNYSSSLRQEWRNYNDRQSVLFALNYKFGNTKIRGANKAFGNQDEKQRLGY